MQGDDGEVELALLLPPLDSAPGPARRLLSARTARMVSAIVDAASAAPVDEPEAPPQAVPSFSPFDVTRSVIFEPPAEPRAGRLARRGLVVASALVASVGSAAAGVWIVVRERPPAESPPAVVAPAPEREPGHTPEREPGHRASDRAPAVADSDSADAPEPARMPVSQDDDRVGAGGPLPGDVPDESTGDSMVEKPAEASDESPDRSPHERSDDALDRPRRRAERRRPGSRRSGSPRHGRHVPSTDPETDSEVESADQPDIEQPDPDADGGTEFGLARGEPSVILPANAPVEDIVALANERRKEKRWRAAEALYERVMRDHAGTDAAAIATVASASLHLDHLADPSGGLRRFRQALRLRPDGALAEEARWGLAETHRALGDDEAERAALRRFLSAHPRSVNALRARQRLTELGAEP